MKNMIKRKKEEYKLNVINEMKNMIKRKKEEYKCHEMK